MLYIDCLKIEHSILIFKNIECYTAYRLIVLHKSGIRILFVYFVNFNLSSTTSFRTYVYYLVQSDCSIKHYDVYVCRTVQKLAPTTLL